MSNLITTVLYTNPANFTFDSNKIEVTGSVAKLKLIDLPNIAADEDFADDTGFTHDPVKTEFSAGVLQQINKAPTDSTLGITYTSILNANWSLNNLALTATLTGAPVINANRIDVRGGGDRSARYENADIGLLANTGTIKLKYTPNYSGSPAGNITIWELKDPSSVNNKIVLFHGATGAIRLTLYSSTGALIFSNYLLYSYVAVSGQEYEFEFSWNASAGSSFRMFIDGVLHGTAPAAPYTRTGTATRLYVGAGTTYSSANAYMSDVILFSTIQHTVGYVSGYTLEETKYLADNVDIPTINYTGIGAIQSLDSVIKTGTNVPAHTPSLGANTVDIQLNFAASNTKQDITQLDLEYTGQIYPTDNPTITINSPFFMTELSSMDAVENKAGLDELKHVMKFQGLFYYMVGDVVTPSNGTYAQSNILAEIQAVLAVAPIDINPDSSVQLVTFLHSDDGSTTPDLTSVTLGYDFLVVIGAVDKCVVYGSVYDNSGNPVAGAKITIDSDDFFYDDALIALSSIGYTNSAGVFDIKVVETVTDAKTVNVTIEYTQEGKKKKTKYTGITIPNQATVALGSIIP